MKRLRVLSIPGRTYVGNPYWRMFCEGLDDVGLPVVEVRTSDALLQRFDVAHIHLPDHQVAEVTLPKALVLAAAFLLVMGVARLRGCPVVWTVHDVSPFKRRHDWLLRPYMRAVMALVSGYVFMNASSKAEFLSMHPGQAHKPSVIIAHGTFPVEPVRPARAAVLRASAEDGTPAFLVGILGDIKPYKNIAALAQVPATDGTGRPIRLVVAGRVDPDGDGSMLERALAAAGAERVHRLDKRLSDEDLAEWISAVDVVLLPYLKGSNSGFAILVLSAGGRLVGSDLPMFHDLEQEIGRPWVYCATARGTLSLADAVLAAARDPVTQDDRDRRDRTLASNSFSAGARRLQHFYQDLAS